MTPTKQSFGGGNQFLNNFIEYLDKKCIKIVYDLIDDDIDIIFMMDPRKLSLNKITCEMIEKYKETNKEVLIIHRINDSDKPRDNKNVLDPIIMKCLLSLDNCAIFVSEFTRIYFQKMG